MPQGAFRSRRPWSVSPEGLSVLQHREDNFQERVCSGHRAFPVATTAGYPTGDFGHRTAWHAPPVDPGSLDQEPAQKGDAVLLDVSVMLGLS